MTPKKILIIGATGFIGSALYQYLSLKDEYALIGISKNPDIMIHKGIIKMDILDKALFQKFMLKQKPDIIFHTAGGRHAQIENMINSNIMTTINLIRTVQAIKSYAPRMMILSSASEYGNTFNYNKVLHENEPCFPNSVYSSIKLLQTQIALDYAFQGGDIIISRLFNILGPGTPQAMAPGNFAFQIIGIENNAYRRKKEITVGDLHSYRDFLDIRDVVKALHLLVLKGKRGEIYNVASKCPVSMKYFLNKMIKHSLVKSIGINYQNLKKTTISYSSGSNLKLIKTTGWRPDFNLEQSIKDTLDYYRKGFQRPS